MPTVIKGACKYCQTPMTYTCKSKAEAARMVKAVFVCKADKCTQMHSEYLKSRLEQD